MENRKLIKKAKKEYPKGTIFTWKDDTVPVETISSGKFFSKFVHEHNCTFIYDKESPLEAVFNGDEWAEIIK